MPHEASELGRLPSYVNALRDCIYPERFLAQAFLFHSKKQNPMKYCLKSPRKRDNLNVSYPNTRTAKLDFEKSPFGYFDRPKRAFSKFPAWARICSRPERPMLANKRREK